MKAADDILAEARKKSGSVALSEYSTVFAKYARDAKRISYWWLGSTVLLAGCIIGFLFWLINYWNQTPTNAPIQTIQAVQMGCAKLALFSTALYLLSWCGRNYKAQWHTYIVNTHRANTLNALEVYANSVKEETRHDAIMQHACGAIFSQITTGFIPDQADTAATPPILEIIRGPKP